MKKLERLLFVGFLLSFVPTASAMEQEVRNSLESKHRLIGPASMSYLKSKSQELSKPVIFHIIIASPDEDDTIERDVSIVDSSLLPNELTVTILSQYFSELPAIFEGYFKTYGCARIHVDGSVFDAPYKATGFDYVEQEAKK
jgi:hypothetical protein